MSLIGQSAVPNPLAQSEYNSLIFQQKFIVERDESASLRQQTLRNLDTTSSVDLTAKSRKLDKQNYKLENAYDHFFINELYIRNTRLEDYKNSSKIEGEFIQDCAVSESQKKR